MKKIKRENDEVIIHSYYRLRKTIGILGILLPFIVLVFHTELLSSISHYYYTKSAVFFIAILSAFGLFLLSYPGYQRDKKTEILSDNVITFIGGIAILIVVLFPTTCIGSNSSEISKICSPGDFPLFGHNNSCIKLFHLISAGIFFVTMGYMSIYRFTKGEKTPEKLWKIKIYRFCGFAVWISISISIIEIFVKKFYPYFYITKSDIYFLEAISVFFFGLSWLIKGEEQSRSYDFVKKYLKLQI